MTLEQQVNFMTIYFICFIPITYLSFHWVYVLMCETVGKTVKEVREMKKEILRSTIDRQIQFALYMEKGCTDIKKYRLLSKIYTICPLINLILAFLAFFRFSFSLIRPFLQFGIILVPVMVICSQIARIIYKHKSK